MKKTWFKLLPIVLSILLIGAILFLSIKYFIHPNIEKDRNFVNELYEMVNPSNFVQVINSLYQNGELDNQLKIDIAIRAFLKEHPEKEKQITSQIVEEYAQKTLGKDTLLEHQTVYLFYDKYCGFHYNEDKKIYEVLEGCGGPGFDGFERKIIDYKILKNEVIITEKMIYYVSNWLEIESEDMATMSIYSDYQKTKLLDEYQYPISEPQPISIDSYLDQASIYEYTFIKEDHHYVFQNIQKKN